MTFRRPKKLTSPRGKPTSRSANSLFYPKNTFGHRALFLSKLTIGVAILLSACTVITAFTKRPQDPYDRRYKIETVRFSGGEGVTLAGELTMPQAGGPFKAVVLISGSGPQDRNEELAGHRPFLVLSDYLTRAGFAVLRYDDRGFADSSGDHETADLYDFADDAAGAYRYLESRSEIDATAIGYIGHSEGGYIAPVAARQTNPSFMVFLAGAVRPLLPDVIVTQTTDVLRAEGVGQEVIDLTVAQYEEGSAILARAAPLADIRTELGDYLVTQGIGRADRTEFLDQFATRWGVSYAHHDPRMELRALTNPVLALFGEKDLQVSAKEEAPVMQAALRHPRSEVQIMAGMNHLFQPSQTGRLSEYSQIETTMSVDVMNRISAWIDGI